MSDTTQDVFEQIKPGSQISADINAGFAFFLDCVVNLFVMAGILIGAFDFPAEIVYGRIIPGCIVGIMVGNLLNIHYTRQLARRTGNNSLTSIPLGIDLPTIIGICFFLLGPQYVSNVEEMGALAAGEHAWKIGIAASVWMGLIKFGLSYFGRAMQTELPQMALIGTMAGIATVWLGANAILGAFALPEVGLISLMIMAYALIGGHKLPFNMPGAVMAIIAGTLAYYIFAVVGYGNGYELKTVPDLTPALPMPTLAGFTGLAGGVTAYLGIIFPFALLIAASAVNVVAGAKIVGDDYDPRRIVQMDAGTTLIMALFGGAAQTTPYFGHTTYKRMGAGTNYALGAALLITIGGFIGVIAFASQLIPSGVLTPILVVVAADILRLAFTGGDVHRAPALLFAVIPGILYYAHTKIGELLNAVRSGLDGTGLKLDQVINANWSASYALLGALSSGYVLTSLLWGSMIVWILDRQLVRAAGAAFFAALAAFFGIIHSVLASSGMYLPWNLLPGEGAIHLPYQFATSYFIAGLLLLFLHMTTKKWTKG